MPTHRSPGNGLRCGGTGDGACEGACNHHDAALRFLGEGEEWEEWESKMMPQLGTTRHGKEVASENKKMKESLGACSTVRVSLPFSAKRTEAGSARWGGVEGGAA